MKNLLRSIDSFTEKIRPQIAGKLPGSLAHAKMASARRKKLIHELPVPAEAKKSAVLILFYMKNEEIHTTLMRRSSYDGTHSGQISFPGGKKDPEDLNLEKTALRELNEEVGINPNKISILGSISELYIPPSNFLVRPYLGFTKKEFTYEPDPREVDEVIEMPLSLIFEEKTIKEGLIELSTGFKVKAPYFDVYGNIVWGATAMILSELKDIVTNSLNT